jgi:hypothetical protein
MLKGLQRIVVGLMAIDTDINEARNFVLGVRMIDFGADECAV